MLRAWRPSVRPSVTLVDCGPISATKSGNCQIGTCQDGSMWYGYHECQSRPVPCEFYGWRYYGMENMLSFSLQSVHASNGLHVALSQHAELVVYLNLMTSLRSHRQLAVLHWQVGLYTVENIRISTDILWRVFHILTAWTGSV